MAEFTNLQKLPQISKMEVKVNGKKTPLSIGDKIYYSDDDGISKTVVAILVQEDGRITYTLEWAELDGDLKQELVTLTELKLLAENASRRFKVDGLSAK